MHRARLKYARSEKGRLNNRLRQKRYRQRCYEQIWAMREKFITQTAVTEKGADEALKREGKKIKKIVTDQSSMSIREGLNRRVKRQIKPFGVGGSNHVKMKGRKKRARCHFCGALGVIARRRDKRGRFRWVH